MLAEHADPVRTVGCVVVVRAWVVVAAVVGCVITSVVCVCVVAVVAPVAVAVELGCSEQVLVFIIVLTGISGSLLKLCWPKRASIVGAGSRTGRPCGTPEHMEIPVPQQRS